MKESKAFFLFPSTTTGGFREGNFFSHQCTSVHKRTSCAIWPCSARKAYAAPPTHTRPTSTDAHPSGSVAVYRTAPLAFSA
eukprot:COSAG04_NODE_17266_length_474_cov_0.840000_1_plen_80_part_01